jgi:hypothetical protein
LTGDIVLGSARAMLPRSLETMSSYVEKRFLPYTPALPF